MRGRVTSGPVLPRRTRVGSLLCVLALIGHGTLLPVVHAEHGAAARLAQVLAAAPTGEQPAALAAGDRAATAAHDPASCRLCATVGRADTALAPVAFVAGVIPAPTGAYADLPSRSVAAPDLAPGVPRGPPARTS